MRVFIVSCLTMILSTGTALACSCEDVTPRSCNLLSNHDVSIFVGTVVSVKNPPKEGDEKGGTARYQFHVEEWLSPQVDPEVKVLSGRGGADCSYWFETGKKYLVFAHRGKNGELWASICSNTQPAADASALLGQLRAMRDRHPVARVYGTVRQLQQPYEGTYQPDFDKSLPELTLHFDSSERRISAKSAGDGSYAVYNLPSGTYRISADLPADLEIAQTILSDSPAPLQLDSSSCVEQNVAVLPTGRIRGRLIGSDGKPLWNGAVELYSVDRYKEGARGWWEFADEKKQYFEFDHVAPGEYVLVFNRQSQIDTDVPYPRTFFPDAPDFVRAEHIRVGPGEQLMHTDIHLNGGKVTRKIRISVLFPGGGEPTNSYLIVKGSKDEDAFPSPVEENIYELNVLLDSKYTITAHTNFCSPETESRPLRFLGATAPPDLTITVPDTKCRPLPPEIKRRQSK